MDANQNLIGKLGCLHLCRLGNLATIELHMRHRRPPLLRSNVKILAELPAWEHSLYLVLFITTSGGW